MVRDENEWLRAWDVVIRPCHCLSKEGNRGNSSPCPDGIPVVPLTGHGGVFGHSVMFAMHAFIHSHTHAGRAGIEII